MPARHQGTGSHPAIRLRDSSFRMGERSANPGMELEERRSDHTFSLNAAARSKRSGGRDATASRTD